jgi:hypothetical protein
VIRAWLERRRAARDVDRLTRRTGMRLQPWQRSMLIREVAGTRLHQPPPWYPHGDCPCGAWRMGCAHDPVCPEARQETRQ